MGNINRRLINDWGRISATLLIAWIATGVGNEREKCVGPDFDQPLQAPTLQYTVLFGIVKQLYNKIRKLIKAFERSKI